MEKKRPEQPSIKKLFKNLLHKYEEIEEADFIAETGENEAEFKEARGWIEFRNLFVLIAAVLFFLSLFLSHAHLMRGIAYFFGAGAYFFELVMLTDGFKHAVPRSEAFMALCFGPLYILMGLAYFLE